jgi:hypothetical protein
MPTKVSGAPKLRLALKRFPTELDKETQKNLRRVLNTVTSKAKGYLPSDHEMLSGWTSASSSEDTTKYRAFPKYNHGAAVRGIVTSTKPSKPTRNGWVSLVSIMNKNAGAAIYETAGRKNPNGAPVPQRTKFTPPTYREDGKGYNKSLNPNAGKQFIDRMNRLGKLVNAREQGLVGRATRKLTGRVIFRAWAEDGGKANAAVIKAIETSTKNFNSKGDLNV